MESNKYIKYIPKMSNTSSHSKCLQLIILIHIAENNVHFLNEPAPTMSLSVTRACQQP